MRFLMLNWRDPKNPKAGGAERVSLAYLLALVKRGHEVCWFANAVADAPREESIEGITVVRGGGYGTSVLEARKWHRCQKPFDLVIDQHHGIPWYAPWWCRTNCVAYIHEVLGPIWSAFYRWPLCTVGRWQERASHRLYRNVPFWVGSESTRKAMLRQGVRHVTLIPYGVDTPPLPALEPKPMQSPVRLVAVSRLAANKRIDHVIRVLAALRGRGVAAQLTVVGTGEEEGRLRALTQEFRLGQNVTFTGPLPEAGKNQKLREAHWLVHTSIREGWGLNVIEANAMGTPAVVYPVGGLVDSTVHGETGVVTPAETPEAVAAAIEAVLKEPDAYERYRSNGWQRSKTFQWNVVLPAACEWLERQAQKRI